MLVVVCGVVVVDVGCVCVMVGVVLNVCQIVIDRMVDNVVKFSQFSVVCWLVSVLLISFVIMMLMFGFVQIILFYLGVVSLVRCCNFYCDMNMNVYVLMMFVMKCMMSYVGSQ